MNMGQGAPYIIQQYSNFSILQPNSLDSEPNRKLSLPSEKFLRIAKAAIGMLQLQKPHLIHYHNFRLQYQRDQNRRCTQNTPCGSKDPYPIARSHFDKLFPTSNLEVDSPFQDEMAMVSEKEERTLYTEEAEHDDSQMMKKKLLQSPRRP